MGFMQLQRGRSFIYKKALVWQEKGGYMARLALSKRAMVVGSYQK